MTVGPEKSSVRLLRDFLRNHGYKEEEIITEYRAVANRGKPIWVDAVVVDHLSGTPLLAFEIKTGAVKHDEPGLLRQLQQVSEAFKPVEVLTYLAHLNPDQRAVQIWEYLGDDRPLALVNTNLPRPVHNRQGPEATNISESPSLPDSQNAISRVRLAVKQRRETSASTLAKVCRWLAVSTFLLAVVDLTLKLGISAVHVSLLGITCLLLVAPFATQINLLGVELKGLNQEDHARDE